jgi:hypothetical protein
MGRNPIAQQHFSEIVGRELAARDQDFRSPGLLKPGASQARGFSSQGFSSQGFSSQGFSSPFIRRGCNEKNEKTLNLWSQSGIIWKEERGCDHER